MLGMTAENLSRSFSVLRRTGVQVDGPKITVESIDELKEIARHAPLIDNFPDSLHNKKPNRGK